MIYTFFNCFKFKFENNIRLYIIHILNFTKITGLSRLQDLMQDLLTGVCNIVTIKECVQYTFAHIYTTGTMRIKVTAAPQFH